MSIMQVTMTITFATLIIALINTVQKDKLLVKETGDLLPLSSYLFLVIRHLLVIASVAGLGKYFNKIEGHTLPDTLGLVGLFLLAHAVSFIAEVVIRFVITYILMKVAVMKSREQE